MGFLSKVGGGLKGLVKRSVAAATGGVIAGGATSSALTLSDDITAIIAAITALMGIVGNLLREYYKYRESIKEGS
jgi:phage-related minor tail protein